MRVGMGCGIPWVKFPSGGAAFAPSDLSGLEIWLQPSGLPGSGAIATWTDDSGNGRDATQATEANQPAVGNALNGLGGAVFSAAGADYLNFGALTLPGTSRTVFVVMDPDGAGGTISYVMDFATTRLILAHYTDTTGKTGFYDTPSWRSVADATEVAQIMCWVLDADGEMFRDGTSLGTGAYTGATIDGSVNRIASNSGAVASHFNGTIYEILYYSSALSVANRQSVESYLADKYAL